MEVHILQFLCSFGIFLVIVSHGEGVLIDTKQGKIQGQIETSRGGRHFYAFYGIPYAEPPVGELRFEDPVPAKNWKGVLDGTKLPPVCMSNDPSISGQEDCLYLNLYTPKIEQDSLLPVYVFIYGSNFMYGHAQPSRYGPHYFMDKDLILITFHYRLGPFGFLNTADEVMPGNYGVKDVVEVLRWVQKNIESYGGDKERVTIGGGSSGGSTVFFTLLSPLAKGLFHRCITQSGIPIDLSGPEVHRSLAFKFGFTTSCRHENISTSQQLKTCLKNLPAQEIGENINTLHKWGFMVSNIAYSPAIENEKIPDAFLIDQPSRLLNANINVPLLLGVNSGEGGILAVLLYLMENPRPGDQKFVQELDEHYYQHFPQILAYASNNDNADVLQEKTESIVKRYFGKTKISENYEAFAQMFTDLYSSKLRETIRKYRGVKYAYYYDHRNEESFDKYYGSNSDEDLGVIHGDELISMFNWSEAIKPVTEGIDLMVSEQVLELWTNFITFGDPNGVGPKLWSPATTSQFTYLHIRNGELKMETELKESEYNFWNSIWSASKPPMEPRR